MITRRRSLFLLVAGSLMVAIGYYSFYSQGWYWLREGPSISYLSKEETRRFLAEDRDGYMIEMTGYDLLARRAKSHTDYRNRAIASADSYTREEKVLLDKAIAKADDFFHMLDTFYLDQEKMEALPWKLALTRGNGYEDGLPHTREDIIFLDERTLQAPEETLIRTLIHEKVHIYQRRYKKEFQETLQKQGYVQWMLRKEYPRARSNPDLDEYVYLHPTKEVMVSVYANGKPINIQDVVQPNGREEHPNEEVAYEIAKEFHL